MKKGIFILGLLIIVSSVVFLIADIFGNYFFNIAIFIKTFSSYLAIIPTEIPCTKPELSNSLLLLPWIWAMVIFTCGILILKLNNRARIVLIILNLLRIISLVICISISKFILIYNWEYVPILIFPFLYLLFFTHPKVKKQFK
ncbi:MAG: hypothetical protein KBB01_04850 [Candidatus Omnitrophica bacterium]|jgi:hypothetical protein|nr:hypothetical protein [Candidatus Omnitrophota bacterium]